jgi:hypothetical protein
MSKMASSYEILMEALLDPAVRDLAWVIGAPNLLDAAQPGYQARTVNDVWCQTQLALMAPWLNSLDLRPDDLHRYIADRPTRRLGRYFELLLGYFLAHLPDTTILATNLQVQNEQRTLGEYDLVFRDSQAGNCHWEAAIKFYLQLSPVPTQDSFVGPGGRDRLDLKLRRVFNQQLALSHTAPGKRALPAGVVLDKVQAYIKGYLFYPAQGTIGRPAPPDIPGVSAAHLRGWWVRHPVAMLPQSFADSAWTILPRIRWLAPLRLQADAAVLSNSEMCGRVNVHFAASSEALLLAELRQVYGLGWHEVARGFVVANSWPSIASV